MSEVQNQKKIERWAYFLNHDDGLRDILIGLIAMGFSLMIASDKVIFWLIFYILGIGLWRASENWVTDPGKVNGKVSEKGKGSKVILIGIIAALLLLLFILGFILLNLKGLTT